jgi:hypothetical protein
MNNLVIFSKSYWGMKTSIRIILSLFVFAASLLFCLLVISSLVPQLRENRLLSISISILIALAISVLAWKKMSINTDRLEIHMLAWGIIIGSIGLIAGFVGPIIFNWGGNQGPLLGILYTGPLGFIIGLISGAIYWKFYRTHKLAKS